MKYKGSKVFTTSKRRKIKYFLLNKKSQILIVFFHGFMSDMTGKKPSEIQKFCNRKKLDFLKFVWKLPRKVDLFWPPQTYSLLHENSQTLLQEIVYRFRPPIKFDAALLHLILSAPWPQRLFSYGFCLVESPWQWLPTNHNVNTHIRPSEKRFTSKSLRFDQLTMWLSNCLSAASKLLLIKHAEIFLWSS